MKLEIDKPLFVATINDYLSEKMAKGISFPFEHTSASAIRMYIQSGVLCEIQPSKRALRTECLLPEEKIYQLLRRHIDNPLKEIDRAVNNNRDYRTGISFLMQTYPELKYAKLNVDSREIIDYLYIEGYSAHKAIACMLHNPKIDTPTLYEMLISEQKLGYMNMETLHPQVRELSKRMELPEGVFCNYGAACFYFYEQGKTGYATVHPDRSVKWYGEPLSQTARNQINHIATAGNYLYINKLFFQSQAIGRINMPMADIYTGQVRDIYLQKYTDNQKTWDVMMENGIPLKEGITSNLVEMKGRFSQIQCVQRNDGMYIRCRIDGEMQMYEKVKPEDYQRYKEGKWSGQDLAARYFVGQFLAMQQDRQQNLKR